MNSPNERQRFSSSTETILDSWGYGSTPLVDIPLEIRNMADLAHRWQEMQVGQIAAELGLASQPEIESLLKDKPTNQFALDFLAHRIDGLRSHMQRILSLQNGRPYFTTLPELHPDMEQESLMNICNSDEVVVVRMPVTHDPCIVFSDHDKLRAFDQMGRSARQAHPLCAHFAGVRLKLACADRTAINQRLVVDASHYAQHDNLEIITRDKASSTDEGKLIARMIDYAISKGASNIAIQPTADGMSEAMMHRHERFVPIDIIRPLPPQTALAVARLLHQWSHATYTSDRVHVQGNLQGPAGGNFLYSHENMSVFIRASFTPPDYLGGQPIECISLRLLNRDQIHVDLRDQRLDEAVIETIDGAIERAYGSILLVGRTGSGKSTTIHGILGAIHSRYGRSLNSVSIENPVERISPGIVPHSINHRTGFDTLMAEILRQNPNLIYIGEIRDRSSASIAVRAANSGHRLLSTLHANDTISAIAAMRAYISNKVVDSTNAVIVTDFDFIESLNVIIAQDLVPELCPNCAEPLTQEEREIALRRIITLLEIRGRAPVNALTDNTAEATHFRQTTGQKLSVLLAKAKKIRQTDDPDPRRQFGCEKCDHFGTIGVLPINETLVATEALKTAAGRMFAQGYFDPTQLRRFVPYTLFDAALKHVAAGRAPYNILTR